MKTTEGSRILFTGIIEEVGTIRDLRRRSSGGVLVAGAKTVADGLHPGDSVAVNGACLTVTEASRGSLTCDLSAETLQRTTFQGLREGARVNLERSLSVGSRLGGHFVLGHVDRVGKLLSSIPAGDGWLFSFEFPADLAPYFVLKGSIAVDGISLTVASIAERSFAAAVIPYTFAHTNLGDLKTGDPVNLEVDILGKYVERFVRFGTTTAPGRKLTEEYLREQGF